MAFLVPVAAQAADPPWSMEILMPWHKGRVLYHGYPDKAACDAAAADKLRTAQWYDSRDRLWTAPTSWACRQDHD